MRQILWKNTICCGVFTPIILHIVLGIQEFMRQNQKNCKHPRWLHHPFAPCFSPLLPLPFLKNQAESMPYSALPVNRYFFNLMWIKSRPTHDAEIHSCKIYIYFTRVRFWDILYAQSLLPYSLCAATLNESALGEFSPCRRYTYGQRLRIYAKT